MAIANVAAAPTQVLQKPKRIAAAIIAGHSFQHMYADGFLVLLPSIYSAFGLTPLSAGVLSAVRQASGGLLTMGGGFFVDMFSGKRALFLAGSLFAMGLGYLLAAVASNYVMLVVVLGIASAAGSFWHPVGLGILSRSFPQRRALMMSLHRSSGAIGETLTPLVVAAALLAITWRQVLLGGFLLITAVALVLFVTLSRLGLGQEDKEKEPETRKAGEQLRSIGTLFKDRALPTLLLVSGLRGMADRGFVFFLPLFILRDLEIDDPNVSDAEVAAVVASLFVLMSIMSIVIPPVIGLLADRTGRKPMMVGTLLASTVLTGLLWYVGEVGWAFYVLIAAFGAVRFAVTNLTQAASLDIAEGKRLEGSMIGLLWGNNATFGALSPLILGGLITLFATSANEFELMFVYVFVLTLAATFAGFFLPNTGRPDRNLAPTTA